MGAPSSGAVITRVRGSLLPLRTARVALSLFIFTRVKKLLISILPGAWKVPF